MHTYTPRPPGVHSEARRIFARHELSWHGNVLQLGRRKLAQIEPDLVWPGMWRVRKPDGRLTDMVNLTRARDAACALALAHLNQRDQETPAGAPPIAPTENSVPGDGGRR
jgi:hypothetical protein